MAIITAFQFLVGDIGYDGNQICSTEMIFYIVNTHILFEYIFLDMSIIMKLVDGIFRRRWLKFQQIDFAN